MASTNENWNRAVELLGLKDKTFFGGVEHCGFTVAQLSELITLGLSKPEHRFNWSPTVETFLEAGKKAEAAGAAVSFIGFLESNGRPDARVTITGIEITNVPDSASLIMDFAQIFHKADEFTTSAEILRAWFD
ncbi:MAG: hypothetical protein FWG23_00380 [Eggerthellaceae bacterium]|nr:hypothetical protein [Eggerthellaceae bacterium]